ncbi:MAG TPA: hypothetical protein PLT68_00970 [Actinomycetota bacterium]|nr:hypothetical protein [Actinomycetota bacterium]
MSYRWQYPSGEHSPVFPTQADAETWIGEMWRSLLADGVQEASLLEEQRVVYGPMSLRPDS